MPFTQLADPQSLQQTLQALREKGYETLSVQDRRTALQEVQRIIPAGASVMHGTSTTLEQIGYTELLRTGNHSWRDLHTEITQENDSQKRHQLRRQSVLADFYLGSVHALTEQGEYVVASNTGSQLPQVVYTSPNALFVVSTKKIVPTLEAALERVHQHVVPLEDQRAMKAYGVPTALNKTVIIHGESPMNERRVYFLLVEEDLGF